MSARLPVENSDTVNLVCALLVRYPEIASMRSTPGEGSVRFSFAVSQRLDRPAQRALVDQIESHVESFLTLTGEGGEIGVECESDRAMSFVHVTRDLETFTKDELAMLTSLFADRFGAALVRNPVPDEHPDEDPVAAGRTRGIGHRSLTRSRSLQEPRRISRREARSGLLLEISKESKGVGPQIATLDHPAPDRGRRRLPGARYSEALRSARARPT